MTIKSTPYAFALFLGDILALVISLWVTLWLRRLSIPDSDTFYNHLIPFSYIFAIWLLVYFIYDLYRKQTSFFNRRLLSVLFNAHMVNSVVAISFFYLIPYFEITPKTNMFIFLFVSFLLMAVWRIYLAKFIFTSRSEIMLFACRGTEVDELMEQFSTNPRYNIGQCAIVDDPNKIAEFYPHSSLVAISSYGGQADFIPHNFYPLLFSGTRFVRVENLYEDLFGRIPLSLISERWFLENVSTHPKALYDFLKRLVDILAGIVLSLLSLVLYPFIYLAIKSDDGGPAFITQERVGQNGRIFKIYKFRTMFNGQITRVGRFLRRSRLDELPQLWSILLGDMSLVGPRPELPNYVEKYKASIPYYDVRHLIAPGLSGWAQIYHENHPHFAPETEATREKLSYDLYYIKNRSLILDLTIILKTIRILISRSGK